MKIFKFNKLITVLTLLFGVFLFVSTYFFVPFVKIFPFVLQINTGENGFPISFTKRALWERWGSGLCPADISAACGHGFFSLDYFFNFAFWLVVFYIIARLIDHIVYHRED